MALSSKGADSFAKGIVHRTWLALLKEEWVVVCNCCGEELVDRRQVTYWQSFPTAEKEDWILDGSWLVLTDQVQFV